MLASSSSASLAPGGGGGGCSCDPNEAMNCQFIGGDWHDSSCTCVSPVILDTHGDGFSLTSSTGGVSFDIDGDGTPEQLSWTAADSGDAFLFLDRNQNNIVDSGQELFGNFTPQPSPPQGEAKNGFLALAVYDGADNGGNGDGVIDSGDTIFSRLRLWQDTNHNGVSEAQELHTLPSRLNSTLRHRAPPEVDQLRAARTRPCSSFNSKNRLSTKPHLARAPSRGLQCACVPRTEESPNFICPPTRKRFFYADGHRYTAIPES